MRLVFFGHVGYHMQDIHAWWKIASLLNYMLMLGLEGRKSCQVSMDNLKFDISGTSKVLKAKVYVTYKYFLPFHRVFVLTHVTISCVVFAWSNPVCLDIYICFCCWCLKLCIKWDKTNKQISKTKQQTNKSKKTCQNQSQELFSSVLRKPISEWNFLIGF